MPYKARDVANKIISLAIEKNKALTQISVLKLIYFAHAVHLVLYKEPLIDEDFYAWPFGPVIPSLYHDYLKKHVSDPILKEINGSNDIKEKNALDSITATYEQLGDCDPFKLVDLTHRVGGAWDKTAEYDIIKNKDIMEEFSTKIKIRKS